MIINLKSDTDLSGFYVVYKGSTNLEKAGWYGISHLMEHLVCKHFEHLVDDFERDGIDWNAYTSGNEIVFYLQGLDEKVNKWKYEFTDLLTDFKITEEQFNHERKIVLEEYMDAFNDQTSSHMLNLSRKLFNDYDPIGLKQDLEKMKYLDCINFFELQYAKPDSIINVSRKNKFKSNVIDFAKRKIDNTYKYGNHKTILELNNDFKDKTSIAMLSPLIEEDNAYVHFVNSMLGMGLNSPLYLEVREKKGLVYYIHCSQSRMNNQGITTISTQTSNKNADEVISIVKKVLSNPDKFLTKERFENVKESFKVRKKKDKIMRYKNVNQWINPEGWSIAEIVDDITMKNVRDTFDKYYDPKKFYISKDKEEFKETKKQPAKPKAKKAS